MSAKKVGSTHVAFGFLIGFVSLDFGLTTVSSCLIWVETVRDQLARGESVLQFGEIRSTLMDDDHFAVEDRLTWNIQRAGDHGEALGQSTVAGEGALLPLVELDLDPIRSRKFLSISERVKLQSVFESLLRPVARRRGDWRLPYERL